MSGSKSKNRRTFFKTCLATATIVSTNPKLLAQPTPLKQYNRALLIDQHGEPMTSQSLKENQAYIFHYPYITSPCFLIDIGRALTESKTMPTADQGDYQWQGGVGANQSIVAFSAICTHKLSYPTKTVSFINYRPETVRFFNANKKSDERSQLIYCCSERSAYDPTRGAEVIGGPARQPLTTIEIEYDKQKDWFYACGTRGGELYDEFFKEFSFRLALDHGVENAKQLITDKTNIYSHDEYSQHAMQC